MVPNTEYRVTMCDTPGVNMFALEYPRTDRLENS